MTGEQPEGEFSWPKTELAIERLESSLQSKFGLPDFEFAVAEPLGPFVVDLSQFAAGWSFDIPLTPAQIGDPVWRLRAEQVVTLFRAGVLFSFVSYFAFHTFYLIKDLT